MKSLKNILFISVGFALLFVAGTGTVSAFSFGPPEEKTGAPNEGTCADANCHTGNDLNAAGGSLMVTIPETYQPNEVYEIIVNLARDGQSRWGFEMTALDGNGASAGSFEVSDAVNTQLKDKNSKQYIMHTAAGSAQGTNDENQWTLKWTAPDTDIGPITFYAAGNAANGNFIPTGDYIYTTQEESTPPVPVVAGVSLEVVGDTALSTMNTVEGVSYTLKVTNTGNMMDTITLEVSEAFGTLSDNSIDLEADADAEVTLTVAGDALKEPGAYEVKVTAASQTDNAKTAEATTTTTIEMPPPPPTPEVPPPPPTPWDVNADGTVNIQDLVLVASEFGRSGESLKGDVNGDGTVNIQDLVLVASHFGEDTNAGQ